ncbi:MAG: hypothetical protein ACNA8W_19175 [Bradymonadaceae bacterium]
MRAVRASPWSEDSYDAPSNVDEVIRQESKRPGSAWDISPLYLEGIERGEVAEGEQLNT